MSVTNSSNAPKDKVKPGTSGGGNAAVIPNITKLNPSSSKEALAPITDAKRPVNLNIEDGSPTADHPGFNKPKGMRAINTPTAPIHVDRRFWPRDMRGLLEIYEQGYTLQQGMQSHAQSTTNALDILTGECEHFDQHLKELMTQMENIVGKIQEQVDKPANVDWTPVHDSLAKIDQIQPENIVRAVDTRLAETRSFMEDLEIRMQEKLAEKLNNMDSHQQDREDRQREELAAVRQEMKATQENVADSFRKTEGELIEALANQNSALKADFSQTLQDVLRLQEKNRRTDMGKIEVMVETMLERLLVENQQATMTSFANSIDDVLQTQKKQVKQLAEIEPCFKTHLVAEFQNARLAEMQPRAQISDIHRMVNDDVGHLFNEIATIQRALNLDYVARPNRALSHREDSRLREIGIQTDPTPVSQSGTQTDEAYFRHQRRKEAEKRKAVRTNGPRVQVAESKAQVGKKKSGYADQERKKQKMREALIKPSYNVTNFYHTTGCSQRIARSQRFENFTFFAILLNALWIAVDTDNNDAVVLLDADTIFQVTENLFCLYFSTELLIRFLAFKQKKYCLKDIWFMFDTVLVLGMVVETWMITAILLTMTAGNDSSAAKNLGNFSILRMGRMVKILRMARLARLLRMVPELVVILKSIGAAFRSVSFFLLLAVIIIYVYAVGFRQMTKGSDMGDQYFKTVPKAMNSLLLEGMLPLYAVMVRDISGANLFYWPLIMSFILLASVTVMNMLVGVLVEVVRTVAERERESMTVIHVTNELRSVMHNFMVELSQRERPDNDSMDGDEDDAPVSATARLSHKLGLSRTLMARGESNAFGKDRSASRIVTGEIPDMSKDTFGEFLSSSQVISLLQDCGADALAILDSMDMIFEEKVKGGQKGLRFVDFVEVVLNMRGTNPATVKDVKEQMRLLKSSNIDSHGKTSKLLSEMISKLRVDILRNFNELRRVVDSDCGSDGTSAGALWVGSRCGSSVGLRELHDHHDEDEDFSAHGRVHSHDSSPSRTRFKEDIETHEYRKITKEENDDDDEFGHEDQERQVSDSKYVHTEADENDPDRAYSYEGNLAEKLGDRVRSFNSESDQEQ